MPKCAFCNDTRRFRMPRWVQVPIEPQPGEERACTILPDWEFDCPNCSSFGYSEIEPVYARRVIDAAELNYHPASDAVIEDVMCREAKNMAMYLLRNGFMRKHVNTDEPYLSQDEVLIELRLGVVNPAKLRKVEARDNEIRLACLESFMQDVRDEMRKMEDCTGWWRASSPLIDRMMTTVYQRIRTQLEQDNAQAEQIDRRDAAAPTGHE